LETFDRCSRGDAVQRHIDQRCHTAGSGCPSRSSEAFPIGTAGLVDVDVRIYQSRHQDRVVPDLNQRATCGIIIERSYGADAAVMNVHASWFDRLWSHEPACAYGEVDL
jgi:hypothetical protein